MAPVVLYVHTSISEKSLASVFRVEQMSQEEKPINNIKEAHARTEPMETDVWENIFFFPLKRKRTECEREEEEGKGRKKNNNSTSKSFNEL